MHTIVMAKPGRIRDSLLLLLATIPQLAEVNPVDDAPSLLRLIRECPPDLILMDTDMDHNGGLETLEMLKAEVPLIPCLVIVGSAKQRRIAWNAGADGLLLRGFSSRDLANEIGRLTN
jgi:DNA-binding NarL/FixJ family response regulator